MNIPPFLTLLTPEQQSAAGLPQTWPLAMADRVRFGEIDMLGHVNNAAYLTWFEKVRALFLRKYELTNVDPKTDPRTVIRSGEIHWVKEILSEEIYIVAARAVAYRNTSFTITSEIWSGDLRATFTCVCVTLEQDGSARRPLPQHFIERIKQIDGAKPA